MSVPAMPDVINPPWEFKEGPTAPDIQRVESDDGSMATFRIKHQDHTLGNALRWSLNVNKNIDFAAYTIPHPHSNAIHVRIQSKMGYNATNMLQESTNVLKNVCKSMETVYDKALNEYIKNNPNIDLNMNTSNNDNDMEIKMDNNDDIQIKMEIDTKQDISDDSDLERLNKQSKKKNKKSRKKKDKRNKKTKKSKKNYDNDMEMD